MPGRMGVQIAAVDAAEAVDWIVRAERMGVPAAWLTGGGPAVEPLTTIAAAAMRTERILFGTSIVQTWPRHPIVIAQQTLTLEGLAPGRIRLGIGPGHEAMVVPAYGVEWRKPLTNLREYLVSIRTLLREGAIDFKGEHVVAQGRLPKTVQTPVMASALRLGSYRLCGELADGAISWASPARFLLAQALPALREGAQAAGRPAPPLIAHVPIVVSESRADVRAAAERGVQRYTQIRFYQMMFAKAGFPNAPAEGVTDDLLDALVVSGSEQQVAERLADLIKQGVGEVLASPLPVGDDRLGAFERGCAALVRAQQLLGG